MDDFIKQLVVGTAAQGSALAETKSEVDGLVAGLTGTDIEQRLLLAAASAAVYRQAGYVPEKAFERPLASPPETKPGCSPTLAQHLRRMLDGEYGAFLGEAWQRMAQAGQRLPPELLPLALDKCRQDLRPALVPVLGERGQWLAALNPDWQWVHGASLGATGDLSAEADKIWSEGVLADRVAILRQVRRVDPARAREWLADVWSREKAEHRAKLLETFDAGLSADDEPLLETARRDRAASVRSCAVRYLARLPGSALAFRMTERADAMLSWEAAPPSRGVKAALKVFTGGASAQARLAATPTTAIDAGWEQDGIVQKPPQGIGERAWWLVQTLSLVSPGHWEERFRVGPADIIAASATSEWHAALLEAWSQAAIAFVQQSWFAALWEALKRYQLPRGTNREAQVFPVLQDQLLAAMPADEAGRIVQRLLEESPDEPGLWARPLAALRAPWSDDLTAAWLDALARQVRSLRPGRDNDLHVWSTSLECAAAAMTATGFATAVGPWEIADTNDAYLARWQRELDKFSELVRVRDVIWRETTISIRTNPGVPS